MPKEISHIYFAQQILDILPEEIQETISKHKELYFYGSVAPDIYYYYLPLNKSYQKLAKMDIGKKIHDSSNNLQPIHHLLDDLKNYPYELKNKILCFVAGYLTHVAADIVFHPYIYSITGHYFHNDSKIQNFAQRNHRLFETCMDLFILKKIYKQSIKEFSLHQKLTIPKKDSVILDHFGKAIKQSFLDNIFSEYLVVKFTHYCYKMHISLIKLFQKNFIPKLLFGIQKELYKHSTFVLFYYDFDFCNHFDYENFDPAPHPVTNETITGNFYTFTENIKKIGYQFITSIFEAIYERPYLPQEWEKLIPHYSLNTGLVGIHIDEMKHFHIHHGFQV
ncbi:MAG: zinc dependent phospholipase C family protein [Leptospiraceae bacterium]|nr:zinc dependent phospholipase C family protein [Leptospiraceae bacterium]MDW7976679.1 zinc dependent phospholipase C family protein [Leptospiraceae bacterium]